MLVSEILSTLTASSEWMVLFNLKAIRQITNDRTIAAMYHLPVALDLDNYSHVVLSSEGRFLAFSEQSKLTEPISGHSWTPEDIKTSLAERFGDRLALFNVDEADCLGLGEMSPFAPVLLHLKIQSGVGQAQAIFECSPNQIDYELLRAVGVTFLGGEVKENYYLARFQNRLPVHIHAGILSHFSRTAHCNIFFLRHGNIDAPLKAGLLQAAEHRVNWGKKRSFQALVKLAESACERSLAMTCQPPPPDQAFAYGDLVPLGFVLKGLNRAATLLEDEDETKDVVLATRGKLSRYLLDRRQENLWAFHSQRLVTATDSALVLQGFNEPKSLEALELFADGQGGYYPQLWSTDQRPNKMLLDESCNHWCQADYATTCLVRALRQEAGLITTTRTEYLTEGMSTRSGLYFANPYLVDWVLARAIAQDELAHSLRSQLLAEILASINDDYSFGLYDQAFSTALAILSLVQLGYRGQEMRVAQLRLLEFMDQDGLLPKATPFYSSLRLNSQLGDQAILGLLMAQTFSYGTKQKQIRQIEGEYQSISLYEDTHSLITTALAALAFSEPYSATTPESKYSDRPQQEIHPRYLCRNHSEYIAKFALPPYLATKAELTV
jgi:hypothetical protein